MSAVTVQKNATAAISIFLLSASIIRCGGCRERADRPPCDAVENFFDLSARPGPAEVVANLDSGVPDGEVFHDVPAPLRLQHFLHLLFSELLSVNELQGLSLVRYLVEYLEVLLHARLFFRVDDAVGRDVDDSVLDLR